MLRVAVPNKGTLSDGAVQLLKDAGYRQRRDSRELTLTDSANGVEFFYLRPRDIATYVSSGELDLGITGRDLLTDAATHLPADTAPHELLPLDFGHSTFRLATTPERAESLNIPDGLTDARIATALPGVLQHYLADTSTRAEIVKLDGAVETAIRLGVAEFIADIVDTGTTLRQQGLSLVGEPLARSEAILVARNGSEDARVQQFLARVRGVLVGRQYVMLTYDVRAETLALAADLTPGIEAPTVSPLHREGWVAVQSMVSRKEANKVMDALYEIGARAILASNIAACRL